MHIQLWWLLFELNIKLKDSEYEPKRNGSTKNKAVQRNKKKMANFQYDRFFSCDTCGMWILETLTLRCIKFENKFVNGSTILVFIQRERFIRIFSSCFVPWNYKAESHFSIGLLKQYYGLNILSVFYNMSLCCHHKRDFVMLIVKSFLQFHQKLFYFCITCSSPFRIMKWKKVNSNLLIYAFIDDLGKMRQKHFWGLHFFFSYRHMKQFAAMILSGSGHISWRL